jgi:hypothetical protein
VVGLAAAVDYPGWLLLVPLLAVAWGAWRRLAIATALALLLSIPAWFEVGSFADRFGGGERSWPSVLWHGLGPVLALSAVGLVLALVDRRRADLALASFVIAYSAYLLVLPEHRARYTLPLVAPLGALAGRMRQLVPVALLLLVLPLTWSIRDTRELRRTASTMIRGDAACTPALARSRGSSAARLRLLGRRVEGRGGPSRDREPGLQVSRRLAEARRSHRCPGVLRDVAP